MTCDWNPELNCAANDFDSWHGDAVIVVGSQGEWNLCDSCVQLPRFKNYKVKKILKKQMIIEEKDKNEEFICCVCMAPVEMRVLFCSNECSQKFESESLNAK